jgi:thymidine phosphorylase
VETLDGDGPSDLVELVLGASAHLLALSDLGIDAAEGRRRAEQALADGSARAQYERWVRAQGGDPGLDVLPQAAVTRTVPAPDAGHVTAIAAKNMGLAALHLGAGRATKEHAIDHAVGVVCLAKRGDHVQAGEPLAEVHARDDASADRGAAEVAACYRLGPSPPEPRPIVLDVLG